MQSLREISLLFYSFLGYWGLKSIFTFFMKPKFNKTSLISLFFIFSSSLLSAQEKGLDERINDAFTPIANWWEGLILHNFPGTEIPTIIFLLVGGALFFTIYFVLLMCGILQRPLILYVGNMIVWTTKVQKKQN